HIKHVWNANLQVYGADKVWKQMNRESIAIARCTVERLMRREGLKGAIRGKTVRTTIGDTAAPCPLDRVNRQFKADRPNQLWSRISPTCRLGKDGCTSPLLSTSSPGASWAGR